MWKAACLADDPFRTLLLWSFRDGGAVSSDYRSEIRDSDIRGLEDRVGRGGYDTYLKQVVLKRVRAFRDREVTFDFPVTALARIVQ